MKDPDSKLIQGLYIIATPIGNMGDISHRALETLSKIDILACEDTRETGKLTGLHDIEVKKLPYHEHNAAEMRPKIISMIKDGKSVGLVSDAGMPLISDPGYKLVEGCIAEGLYVTCVPGASATLTALVLSGLPSDKFMFAGFLPPKTVGRKKALQDLQSIPATLIFYETAPRLVESLRDMHDVLGDRRAAVARELTKKFEEVRRDSLQGLLAHYEEIGPPRGEIVIVVAPPGAETASAVSDADTDLLLHDLIFVKKMSVKDAAAFVSAQTGLKKKDVYQRAVHLKSLDSDNV